MKSCHCVAILIISLFQTAFVPTLGFHVGQLKQVAHKETVIRVHNEDFTGRPCRRHFVGLMQLLLPILADSQSCNASAFGRVERRELAFCLVNLLRVQYWAEIEVRDMYDALKQADNSTNQGMLQQLYLEARLGAKAAVTGKIGGGATNRVYTMASLKFRESLDDLAWYARAAKKAMALQLITDLIESLASIVEFDGLESTQDPSPRSTLTLSRFDKTKLDFVRRMLQERIIPTAQSLFLQFDPEIRKICLEYVQANYAKELPERIAMPSESGVVG